MESNTQEVPVQHSNEDNIEQNMDDNTESDPDEVFLSRTINFSRGYPQMMTVCMLRYAWARPAPEDLDLDPFKAKLQDIVTTGDLASFELPDDANFDVDTEWKKKIYYNYNHLFHDITTMPPATDDMLGHIHPPAESHFAITSRTLQKTFETDVFILPAYLADNRGINISTTNAEGVKTELADFHRNAGNTWLGDLPLTLTYLKRDMPIDFEITRKDKEDTAEQLEAVMVVGTLCTDLHGKTFEEQKEDLELQGEVASSQAMVMMMFQNHQRQLAQQRQTDSSQA